MVNPLAPLLQTKLRIDKVENAIGARQHRAHPV